MSLPASTGCDLAGMRVFDEKIENICWFDEGFNLTPKAVLPGPKWWSSIRAKSQPYKEVVVYVMTQNMCIWDL